MRTVFWTTKSGELHYYTEITERLFREEWKEKRKRISVFVARIHNIVTDVRINLSQINQ